MDMFGIPNEDNIFINHLNDITLTGKFYIYNCKKKGLKLETYKFLLGCKHCLSTKMSYYATNQKTQQFNQQWGELYICLDNSSYASNIYSNLIEMTNIIKAALFSSHIFC